MYCSLHPDEEVRVLACDGAELTVKAGLCVRPYILVHILH